MCRRGAGALVLILLLGGGAGPLPAQSAQVWRDSAMVLARKVRALKDSLLQGDSSVTEVSRRGDLVIGASLPWRGRAASALEEFVGVRTRWFGEASPSPAGFRIVLRSDKYYGDYGQQTAREIGMLVLAGLPDTGASARTQRNASRSDLAAALIDLYAEMMWASAGPALSRWLELTPPLSQDEKERRYVAMYAVVTGTGRAQRACVAGELAACGYVLGLKPPAGTEPGGMLAPLVRTDLMLSALKLGGAGAWTRFKAGASDGVEAALTAAAGMPLDSLLATWHREILALRPTHGPLAGSGVLLLLGWSSVALAAALGGAHRR